MNILKSTRYRYKVVIYRSRIYTSFKWDYTVFLWLNNNTSAENVYEVVIAKLIGCAVLSLQSAMCSP